MISTPKEKAKDMVGPHYITFAQKDGPDVRFEVSADTIVILEILKQTNELLKALCAMNDPRTKAVMARGLIIPK